MSRVAAPGMDDGDLWGGARKSVARGRTSFLAGAEVVTAPNTQCQKKGSNKPTERSGTCVHAQQPELLALSEQQRRALLAAGDVQNASCIIDAEKHHSAASRA